MLQNHVMNSSVLREYDVRGVVGDTISVNDAYAVGRGFASVVADAGGSRIAVCYDGRLTSPDLEAAVVSGMTDAGVTAVRIGRGSSPMLYFATHRLDVDAGLMVTGSHNPPDYNGFKMSLGTKPFFGDRVQDLGRRAAAGRWRQGQGRVETLSIKQDYIDAVIKGYGTDKPLNVAWDCGNGAAAEVVGDVVKLLPGRQVVLNGTVDGTFPAHHPDPTVPHNLVQLQQAVIEQKLDAGIAFDGDADRIGMIDGLGRIIWGDQMLAILAKDILTRQPGATVIADVKASNTLFAEVAKAGGAPLMWKTGHSLIKSKMQETGAPLAGEMSGHIFIAEDFYGFDDALYVGLRLLDIMARTDTTAAAQLDALPAVYNTPEVRFACDDSRKFDVVAAVARELAADNRDVNGLDGVRVNCPDGWWLLRASNTQPVLVVRCEAESAEALGRVKDEVRHILAGQDISPPEDF